MSRMLCDHCGEPLGDHRMIEEAFTCDGFEGAVIGADEVLAMAEEKLAKMTGSVESSLSASSMVSWRLGVLIGGLHRAGYPVEVEHLMRAVSEILAGHDPGIMDELELVAVAFENLVDRRCDDAESHACHRWWDAGEFTRTACWCEGRAS